METVLINIVRSNAVIVCLCVSFVFMAKMGVIDIPSSHVFLMDLVSWFCIFFLFGVLVGFLCGVVVGVERTERRYHAQASEYDDQLLETIINE